MLERALCTRYDQWNQKQISGAKILSPQFLALSLHVKYSLLKKLNTTVS